MLFGKALHVVEEFQLLPDCQVLDESIELGAISQILPYFLQVLADLKSTEVAVPRGRHYLAGQHLERGSLPCSIDPQQPENFSLLDTE